MTVALSVVALGLTLPAPGAVSAATVCRSPVVRDVMISQGLPSYKELARGKTALVKFFLSEPSSSQCSNVTSESIAITGGRLTVQNGSVPAPVVPLDVPTSGALPEFSSYNVAPVTSTPSDPRFVVDGRHLTSASPLHGASTFAVSFSASLDYVTRNRDGVVETGTVAVNQRPGGAPLTATVSKPVKPLRLLVVPMGDADATAPEQFPDAAETELASGIAAVSRTLPVPDGSGPLAGTSGMRWQLSAGMVDLGLHTEVDPVTQISKTVNYMPNGTYCGGGSSFDYVQKQLAGFRSAWNAENPTTPVDRVLGVVWRDVSVGDATGNGPGCAEGYAGVGGTVAWARVVPASSTRRGVTGSLSTLELTHGFGGSVVSVTQTSSGPQPGPVFPHSFSATADKSAPDRAYNVPERAFLDATRNRSVMAYDRAPWDDYNTLYEKPDWDYVLCFLSTSSLSPSKDCGSPASAGAGVSAAGGSYVLGGSTDGTPEGTDAHTYFDADMPRDGADPASGYRLVQRDATGATTGPSTGVLMTTTGSDHSDGDSSHRPLGHLAFDVAIPQQSGAVVFELWKGEPGSAGAVRLFRRALDAQAPVITATGTAPAPSTPVRYTSDGTSRQPAVSPSGALVAFTTPTGVVVARSTSSLTRSNAVAGEQAAWRPDGQELAIVRDGEVYLVPVTAPATGAPVLGTPRKVYGSGLGAGTAPASRPAFSPDASELAVSINGDLFAINLRLLTPDAYPVLCPLDALVQDVTTGSSGLACRRLTATPDLEAAPAWSDRLDLIAYVRTPTSSNGRLWTLDPSTPTSTAQQRLAAPGESFALPAWSGTRLIAARGAGLFSVDASFGGMSALTSSAGDTWPAASASGDRVVYSRPAGTAADLFTFGLSKQSATATVQDDNPKDLRMDLFLVCDGTADPQVVRAWPSSVDEARGEAYFDLSFATARGCPVGQLLYRATDGYRVTRKTGETVTGGGTATAAIYLPKPDAVVLQYDSLSVAGAAKSASGAATDRIAWTLTGPDGVRTSLGVGTVLPDVVAPAGGWTPGAWTVTAVPDGDTSAAQTRVFAIVGDGDGDGIPNSRDTRAVHSCFPENAATDAANALDDPDNDLIVSLLDPEPCTSAMNAAVDFDPDTVNLGSSGTPITLRLTTSALDVRKVTLGDVVISQVGGFRAGLPAESIAVRPGAVLEAKFARQAFIDFFNAQGLKGYVPVVMSVTRAGATARGFDPTAPVYQPS